MCVNLQLNCLFLGKLAQVRDSRLSRAEVELQIINPHDKIKFMNEISLCILVDLLVKIVVQISRTWAKWELLRYSYAFLEENREALKLRSKKEEARTFVA